MIIIKQINILYTWVYVDLKFVNVLIIIFNKQSAEFESCKLIVFLKKKECFCLLVIIIFNNLGNNPSLYSTMISGFIIS